MENFLVMIIFNILGIFFGLYIQKLIKKNAEKKSKNKNYE